MDAWMLRPDDGWVPEVSLPEALPALMGSMGD